MLRLKTQILISALLFFLPAVSRAEDGVLAVKSGNIEPYNLAIKGVREVFRASEGMKIYDIAGDEGRWKDVLRRIQEERPRLILTFGTFATELARKDIKDTPIVFSTVLNPEESRIVSSLVSHGGNVTGASLDIPFETQFSQMLSIAPDISRVGVLYNPKETGQTVEKARAAAAGLGLTLVAEPVRDATELPRAIDRLFGKIDALWSVADSTVFSTPAIQQIIIETIKHKIPFMGLSPSFVKAGALFSIKWDDTDIGRQAGEAAMKVYARPEEVSIIPVTTPRNLSISVNLQTAKAIGLVVPAKILKKAEVFN